MRSTYKKVSGMTAEIKIRRCYGCGSILQSEDRFETGFVSKKRVGKDEGLCDRCYDLRHPVEGTNQTLDNEFASLLTSAKEKGALFCYIFDSFALDASIVKGLNEILGPNILAIFTKRDILPQEVDDKAIISTFKAQLLKKGIAPVDIILTSAYQSFNYEAFLETIEKYRKGKDVFFVGASQVGKSALINNILMNYNNETGRNITSERIGSEGMSLTEIPLDKDSTLYDTPGIFNPQSLLNQVERRALKYIIPHVPVTPVKETLKSGESLFLGGLARVDNPSDKPIRMNLYFARDVVRTKSKIDKADSAFTSLVNSPEAKPSSATVKSITDLEKHRFTLPNGTPCYSSIFGYGKLTFEKGEGQDIDIFAPKEVEVSLITDSGWLDS